MAKTNSCHVRFIIAHWGVPNTNRFWIAQPLLFWGGEVRIKREKHQQKLPSLRYWHVFNIKHHHCWHLMCVSHCFAADDNKYTNANIAPDKFLSFHHFVAPWYSVEKSRRIHIIPTLDSPFYSNRCELNIHIFVCTCVTFHTYINIFCMEWKAKHTFPHTHILASIQFHTINEKNTLISIACAFICLMINVCWMLSRKAMKY